MEIRMKRDEKEPIYSKIKNGIRTNYYSILVLVIICAASVFLVWNWDTASKALGHLVAVLSPFLIAIFLAYLIMPLIETIKRLLNKAFFRGKAKKACWVISIIISYIIVVGLIVIVMVVVIPQVGQSLRELDVKKLYNAAINYITQLQNQFPILNNASINERIQKIEPDLMGYGTNFAKFIFPVVYGFSKSLLTVVVNCILSIVISCYIIIDMKNLTHQLKRAVFAFSPKKKANGVWKTIKECNHIFNGFLIGKTIDSLIIGVLCFIILSIMHFPYPVLISLIVGITNMIPYFGPFIGAVPGIIIYFLLEPRLGILFSIIILALQQFDGLYLGPKILGDLTGIKPLWVIFSITVGGAYFGVLGMFLGVPVVAVISYLLNIIVKKKLAEKEVKELE